MGLIVVPRCVQNKTKKKNLFSPRTLPCRNNHIYVSDLPHLISKLIQLTGLFCFTNTLVIAGLSCSHIPLRTSVCSTELSAFARLEPEFTKRGVKLLAISADPVEANSDWIDDMEDFSGSGSNFQLSQTLREKLLPCTT